jgi:hypothetical protein
MAYPTILPEGATLLGDEDEEKEKPIYESGLSSQFGAMDIDNPEEEHIGAWGDDITSPDAVGVALPTSTLKEHFGDEDAARGALVEVVNPDTGRKIVAPIIDKGPGTGVIERQGPTIDLTAGAVKELGHSGGLDKAQWRIISEGATPPTRAPGEVQQQAGATTQQQTAASTLPEGAELLPYEPLKIEDAIDPNAPYMSHPRDTGGVKRIIMHGDVNEDADALIKYGRQVDPERGFAPGYHFYIARDGTVKQGAPVDRITNHTLGENSDSIGINIAGADEGKMPTPAQEIAAKQLIGQLQSQYNIPSGNVWGHGELQPNRRNELEGGTIARDIRAQLPEGATLLDESGAPLEPASKVPLGERQLSDQELVEVRGAQPAKGEPTVKKAQLPYDVTPPYTPPTDFPGLVEKPSISLSGRPIIKNPDGSVSSERSFSMNFDGKEVLLPQIVNGKLLSKEEAIEHYRKTGEHMGKFKDAASADAYAAKVHNRPMQTQWTQVTGKAELPPPRVTTKMADQLGLANWIDLESGMEIRRAQPTEIGAFTAVGEREMARGEPIYTPEAPFPEKKATTLEGLANLAKMTTGTLIPADLETAKQAALRVEQKSAAALKGMKAGAYGAVSEFTRQGSPLLGQGKNPFLGKTVAEAKEAIPGLEQRLSLLQDTAKSLASQKKHGSQEMGDVLAKIASVGSDLKYARETAEGKTTESFVGRLSKSTAELEADALEQQKATLAKWAPYIDKARDKEVVMQLADAVGYSGPSTGLAMLTMGNPLGMLVAGGAIWTQQYSDSKAEYKESMQKQGKPVDPEKAHAYAVNQANEQTPLEFGGDVFGYGVFKTIAKLMPGNAGKVATKTFGKWLKETAQEVAPNIFGEVGTEAAQSYREDVIAEKYGVRAPTTAGEKAWKAAKTAPMTALQTFVTAGLPAAVHRTDVAAREGRTEAIKEKLAAQQPQTFAERQQEAKANLKPGVYRNFAEIPVTEADKTKMAEPAAPLAPTAAPAGPTAPTAAVPTIPATPQAPAAAPEPAPLTQDAPMADRKTRAQTMWDNAQAGDVYTHPESGNTVTIKKGSKTGERYAEITGENGEYIDTVNIDREGSEPTKGNGLIYGAEMTRRTVPEAPAAAAPAPTIPVTSQKPLPLPGETPPPIPTTKVVPEEEGPTSEAELEVLKQKYEAEREGKLGMVGPSGASAAKVLEFDDEQPTTQRAAGIRELEKAVSAHPRSEGQPVSLIPVSRRVGRTKSQKALNRTIDGLEKLFNKRVQFVRSGTDRDLPFTGIIHPSDPNTIYLDARGDRNVLALIGHEWGHTLKVSNPQLHGQMVEQMKPLVREWAKQEGKLKEEEGYPEKEVSDEVASNTIGDAFTRPDFWKGLNKRNPSLFKRAVKSVHEFFKSLIAKARGSEWGTEEFISDIKAMHKVIADAVNEAVTKGPEPKAAGLKEAMPSVQFAPRGTGLKEAMEEAKGEKLREKMGGLRFAGRKVTEPVAPPEFAVRKHGFYSKLEQTVIDKVPQSATPEQVKGTIAGAQLKPEEIKWSGINQAVDRIASENGGKVPKDKLLQYLRDDGAVRLEEHAQKPTRFEQSNLILPGGENYREVVLALPVPKKTEADLPSGYELKKTYSGRWGVFGPGPEAMPEQRYGSGETPQEALNSYFKLHQGTQFTSSHFPDVPNYMAHMRLNDRTDAEGKPGTFLEEIQSDRHQQGREKGYLEERAPGTVPGARVPDAPFRKDWPLQMFKRALRDAVAEGKKWIGWTTGDTQAERYDLSKQVDEIRASKRNNGDVYIVVRKGGESLFEREVPPNQLSDIVGKELAEKILAQDIGGMKHYSGLDLKVGGEGMKGFYDRMLPTEVGKYVKQWGGKVEQGELDIVKRVGEGWEPSYGDTTPIWKVEVTPQMEKGVSAGQPLFATRKKAKPKPVEPEVEEEAKAPERREAEEIAHEEDRSMGKAAREAARSIAEAPRIKRVIHASVARSINLNRRKGRRQWRSEADISRFWNGTKHVFLNTPGLEYIGDAIRKHVDVRAKYKGKYGNRAKKALGSRSQEEEYRNYWETNQEKGKDAANKLYQTMSPGAKKMVDTSKEIYEELGKLAEQSGIKIYDPETKAWNQFRRYRSDIKDYHPHILRQDILQVLQNPAANPAAWNQLKDQMVAAGTISATNPEAGLKKYAQQYFAGHREPNGFFGSLERRRVADFPNDAYDYSYKTLINYINGWSERMAQTEAFGQGTGHQRTLWNRAIDEAADDYTADYIKKVREMAYGEKTTHTLGRAAMVGNNVATMTQLANWASTIKNFLSGQAFNWQNLGTPRFLGSILNVKGTLDQIRDGYERGNLMHDFMNVMQDGEQMGGLVAATSKGAGRALKVGGFSAAETWVRGTAMVGARSMLRSAINSYHKDPRSRTTRRWLGYLKRLGFDGTDAQDLILEGGKGDLFDSYMRASVNEIQGGYTYADVPVMMEDWVGRTLFKYQKWGSEQLSHFAKEVAAPAMRAITLGKYGKQTVDIINEEGERETLKVPASVADLMPLARYIWVLAAAGAGIEWELEAIFGVAKRTASIAEILATYSKDKMAGVLQAVEKGYMYMQQAGAFGTLGNVAQSVLDVTDRRNFKDPFHPPSVSILENTWNAALDLYDQKDWSPENVGHAAEQWFEKTVGGYRSAKNVAARVNDAFGGDFRLLEVQSREQDLNWLRGATRRYEQDIGAKEKTRMIGRVGKSPESPFRDRLWEDLMMGDAEAAQERIDKHFEGISGTELKEKMDDLRASMQARQPIRAGSGGEDMRVNFLSWAEEHRDPVDVARIKRIDETYRETAEALKLLKPKQTTPKSLQEAMARNAPVHQ